MYGWIVDAPAGKEPLGGNTSAPSSISPDQRRPIAARELAVSQRAAALLCRLGVSANAISLAGMFAGVAAGALLALTSWGQSGQPILWLAAAALVQLRLIANMLDGMVALQAGTASPCGALMNEVPDRVSDTAIFIGLGYAASSVPVLGYLAALAAMATAYVRAVGVATGAAAEFCGPMAKQQRMFLVTLAAIYAAIMAVIGKPPVLATVGVAELALLLITVGSVLTALRRLWRIVRALRGN